MAKDYAKATFKATRARKQRRSRRGVFALILLLLIVVGLLVGWYVHQVGTPLFDKKNIMVWVDDLKALLHRHNKLQVASREGTKVAPINPVESQPEVRFDFYTELPNMQVTLPVTETEVSKGTPAITKTAVSEGQSHWVAEVAGQKSPQVASDYVPAQSLPSEANKEPQAQPLPPEANKESQAQPLLLEASKDPQAQSLLPKANKEPQYVVQVGAYKSYATASEIRVSILLAGFDAVVVKTMMNGQVVYRIQQGPYSSQARAKMAQKKLQAKGFEGIIQKVT